MLRKFDVEDRATKGWQSDADACGRTDVTTPNSHVAITHSSDCGHDQPNVIPKINVLRILRNERDLADPQTVPAEAAHRHTRASARCSGG
jgi:hypothetical protein